MPFTPIDHTADIGVDLEAASLEELFAEAARGFTDALTDLETVEPVVRRHLEVSAGDRELLMVEWLEELVFLFDVEALVFNVVGLEIDETPEGGFKLAAEVAGEVVDPDRHPTKVAIKGITYHELEIRHDADLWRGRVIFDI